MRIVLHIGQPRSGTTAIQQALSRSGAALAKRRVLYPAVAAGGGEAGGQHPMLAAVLDLASPLPRGLAEVFDHGRAVTREALDETFASFGRKIETAVAAVRPDVLVLSTELLFRELSPGAGARMARWLEGLGSDVTVVSYVRRPSDAFASMAWLKLRSGMALSLEAFDYRTALESWHRVFGRRVRVVAYERAHLHGQDIVTDFITRFLPEAVDLQFASEGDINSSPSAEIMTVIHDAMARERAGGVTLPAVGRMERNLRKAAVARGVAIAKPRLRPDIAAHLDAPSAQLSWLRDTFGVIFNEIDGCSIEAARPVSVPAHSRVPAFFLVDEHMRAGLAAHLDRWLSAPAEKSAT